MMLHTTAPKQSILLPAARTVYIVKAPSPRKRAGNHSRTTSRSTIMQHSASDVVRVIRGRWDWAPEIVRPYQCSTGKLSNTPNARMICSEEMKHRCANDTTSWR